MTISRRKFTQTVGLALVGAGCAGSVSTILGQTATGGFPISAESYGEAAMSFTKETFLPYLGTIFKANQNDLRSSLRLLEVTEHAVHKYQAASIKGESFSLFFRNLGKSRLPTDICVFEHPSLGNFSLFLSPVDRDRRSYEAVINHMSAE